MAFRLANRVKEGCQGSGLSNLTLTGAISGYKAFASQLQVGDTTLYTVVDGFTWETGIGTLVSETELSRDTVLDSSDTTTRVNSDEEGTPVKVSLPDTAHRVGITPDATRALFKNDDGSLVDPTPFRQTLIVTTIAAMKAETGLTSGETFIVRYGTVEGDGKGGLFRWDPTDANSPDNIDTFRNDNSGTGLHKRVRVDIQDFFQNGSVDIEAAVADDTGGSLKLRGRKKVTDANAWFKWIADYASKPAKLIARWNQSAEVDMLTAYSLGNDKDRVEVHKPLVLGSRADSKGQYSRSLSWLSGVSRLGFAQEDAADENDAVNYWEVPLTKGGYLVSVVPTVTALKAIDAATFVVTGDKALVLGNAAVGDCPPFYVSWSSSSSATNDDYGTFRPTTGAASTGNGRWLRVNVNPTQAFTNSDATPSIKNGNFFTTAGTPPTAITDFDDAYESQVFTVQRGSADQKITHTSGVIDNGGVDIVLSATQPRATYIHINGVHRLLSLGGIPQTTGIDPRSYGAVGGGTDDTTAFENAADAAVALGVPLDVPPGTWDLLGFTPPSGLHVRGAGKGLSILRRKASASTNVTAVLIQTHDVHFQDVTFDGNKANQTNGANTVVVTTTSAYNVHFEDCEFKNAKAVTGSYGAGLSWVTTGDGAQEWASSVNECVFQGNDSDGCVVKEAYYLLITDNICRQNGGSGIAVANFDSPVEAGSQRMLEITGNVCVDNSGSGIVIHGFTTGNSTTSSPIWGNQEQTTWAVIVSDNLCRHNDLYGIAFQGQYGVIQDNECYQNGGTSYIYGGILFNADYSICSGNISSNNEYYGIDAGGSFRCEITDNLCEGNGTPSSSDGGTGINLGGCRSCRIADNHSFGNGDANAGTQILMTRYDSSGSGLGFPWETSENIIEDNFVMCSNSNQVGIWLRQGPVNCIVRNNTGKGGTENNFILNEATSICEGNRHVSFIGGTVIASASSIVIPDYAENIVITGTTDITGGILTYSRNAYAGKAMWVAMTDRGNGYTSAPAVGKTGGTGTGFSATAYITSDGKVAGVLITGSNADFNGSETLTFTGGGGSGAAGTIQIGCPNIVGGPRRFIFGDALTLYQVGAMFIRGSKFKSDSTGRSILSVYGYYGTNWHEISRSDDVADEPRGFRNYLVNGEFKSWQRGTTFDSTTTPPNSDANYFADQWYLMTDGNDIVDVSRDNATTPTGARYAAKLEVETANKKFGFAQIIETSDCLRLTGRPFVLSCKARKGSSNVTVDRLRMAVLAWSSTADTFTGGLKDFVNVWGAEGTSPTLNSSWTYISNPTDCSLTTSFQRFQHAAISAGTFSNLAIFIWCENDDGTVDDTVFISDIQLEDGIVATAMERLPTQVNLSLCMRWYRRDGVALAGRWASATTCVLALQYSPQMRANPTVALLTTSPVVGEFGVSNRTGTSSTIVTSTKGAAGIMLSIDGFTSATANNSAQGGTTAFLETSAEF